MAGAPGYKVTVTEKSWREIVEQADDKNRHEDSLYPVSYEFSSGVKKKDSGPRKGIYTPP